MSRFTKRIATGLIALQLAVGAMPLAALVAAAPATAATVLREHGAWRGVSDGTGFGVMTKMNHGGMTALIATNDSVTLIMTDPRWHLKVGKSLPVHVQVDGQGYTGQAVVVDGQTIKMPSLTTDFVDSFVDGAEMVVNVDKGDIVWTIDLHGFTASMSDAVRAYKTSY